MKIIKFDPSVHSICRAADLVLSAYDFEPKRKEKSKTTVMGLIETGGNFLGKENIYVAQDKEYLAGLVICYEGKPAGTIKALMRLLLELRLKELLNLMILSAELLHTGHTPELHENDFYISLVVVDKDHRGMGLGSKLLKKAIELAQDRGCTRVVLDVDSDNRQAISLYEKLGFSVRYNRPTPVRGAVPSEIFTMDYHFPGAGHNIESRVKA